jgi:hypothetical protein
VHCIESSGRAAIVGLALLMAGCSSSGGRGSVVAPLASRPVVVPERQGAVQGKASTAPPAVALPAPRAMRNWDDVRLQAAQRIVSANPNGTYMGEVPEALLAIPVLEIELNGDGSVRRIVFLRHPQEAKDTSKLAEAAVYRAAPFGDVSRLPKPWRFTETFLFNHERKFKPRTLDQ